MNNEFYSPLEDDEPISLYEEVDFQITLYDSIIDTIREEGYEANKYTQNVEEIKEIYEELNYDLDRLGIVLASIKGVELFDIMYDPTFQVYIKAAKDLSDMEREGGEL